MAHLLPHQLPKGVNLPNYEYRCNKCQSSIVFSRSVEDRDEPVKCVTCGLESTRIYNAPGVQFKGTGFYKTGG